MNSNWKSYKLSDLTTKIGSGSTPSGGNESYKTNGISLVRSLNVYDNEFKYKGLAFIDDKQAAKLNNVILEEGDVLLNITGASVARCCVIPNDVLPARINQHVSILRPKKEIVDSKFLSLLLNSKIYKDCLLQDGEKAGATRQALTKSQLQNFKILVPSLKEQKRIVTILDEAFAGISQAVANTEKNLANVRELFDQSVNQMFTIKNNWSIGKIEDYVKFIDYRGKTPEKTETGMRLITAKNVKKGFLQTEPREYVSPSIYEKWMTRGIPEKGDILFTTEAPLGNVAQLDTDEKVVFAQRIIIMQPHEKYLRKEFLKYLLLSNGLQKEIQKNATGATAQGIKASVLRLIPIYFPVITEQDRTIHQLDKLKGMVESLEQNYQQKLQSLAELKQSLLQKAFSGELTANNVDKLVNL